MVKKISAILLAFVVCLSVMVVPVSAAMPELTDDATIAFSLEWDKEYYEAGETATLSVFMDVADDVALATSGGITIGFNNDTVSKTDNPIATVQKNAVIETAENADFYSYWLVKSTNIAYLAGTATGATTPMGKVAAVNTAEENAMYDWYIKYAMGKNANGSHQNAASTTDGYYFSSNEGPICILQLKLVVAQATDGAAIVAGIPSGATMVTTPQCTNFKVYTDPGNSSSTTTPTGTTNNNITNATATAKVGVEPCAPEAHVWDDGVVTTDPTCGEAGVKTFTCSVCNSTKTEEVAATGAHTAGAAVKENEVAASCAKNGSYDSVVYCSVCNIEMSRTTETIAATGEHVYATEVSRTDSTCIAIGSVTMACGCGEIQTTDLPLADHKYEFVVTDPTCTDAGYTTYTCSVCNDTYTDNTIDATGHSYTAVVTAPTCTDAGYTTYTCACGDSYTDNEVPATGHSYTSAVTAPTCTDAGYTTYTCPACGDVYTDDEVPATGHNYSSEITTKPNCKTGKEGVMTYTCANCNDTYTEAIPAVHTLEEIPAIAPTCTETGKSAGSRCAKCFTYVVRPETVPATGHSKENGVVTEPTYSEGGYTTYTCHCGVTFVDDYTDRKQFDSNFAIAIKDPSVTSIKARDTIVLHAKMPDGSDLPEGLTIEWTVDVDGKFTTNEINDGESIEITAKKKGTVVFTASAYDVDGNLVATDTVEMFANAGFFQRIGGFFRSLFKTTKYIEF